MDHRHDLGPRRESTLSHFVYHEQARTPFSDHSARHLENYHMVFGCPLADLPAETLELLAQLAEVPTLCP
jgi:hypothetical protein